MQRVIMLNNKLLCIYIFHRYEAMDITQYMVSHCLFSFRTSVQEQIATVKAKAKVVIELSLSVTG